MYKIRYTPEALVDLMQIKEDITFVSGSSNVASRYLRELIGKFKEKKLFPQSGIPLNFEDIFTGYYFVHYKAYNAFYLIKGDQIELIRVLQSKSDYMRILFGNYYEEESTEDIKPDYVNE